jgi:hypothetical protein
VKLAVPHRPAVLLPVRDSSSRLHSELELDLRTGTWRDRHRCFPTVEVDPDTGAVECHRTADTDRMRFGPVTVSGTEDVRRYQVPVDCAANNPCWLGPPDVDIRGGLTVVHRRADGAVEIAWDLLIEPSPAFEMYAQLGEGPPVTLFTRHPETGDDLIDLIGPPTVAMRGNVVLHCSPRP